MSSTKVGRRVPVKRAPLLLAASVCALPAAATRAADYAGGAGVGNWSVPSNWRPAAVPGAGASVNFWDNDDLNRTLNYDYAGPAVTLGDFGIDQPGTGLNTFQMAGLALTTSNTYVASYGSAVFNQSGGIHTTQTLYLGWQPGSRATYTLGGGELRARASQFGSSEEIIGSGGVGVFEHTGGSNTTGQFLLGFQGGTGTYRMSGSAWLQVTGFNGIGGGEGGAGIGLFDQSGGTHLASGGLYVGTSPTGSGTYRLNGNGALTVSSYDMVAGNGTFEQTGGTHTANTTLAVGAASGTPAAYTMSGGTLTAKALSVGGSGSGGATPGTFALSGGTASVTGTVTVGPGGALNVSGGSLAAATATNDAVLNLTGGAISAAVTTTTNGSFTASGGTFSGALANTGTVRVGGSAAFTVTGSVLGNSGGTAVGRLVMDAGGTLVANSVYQESLEMNGSTANPPAPGPVLSIRQKAAGGKTSLVRTLSIPSEETGKPVGRVDLADTALVVDYSQASPIDSVRGLIGAAWAGGTWTGNGLGSSVASTTPGRGLGYREASSMLGPNDGTFEGQPVDGTAVLVKYTVLGDATLNGQVNFDDLLALARHYNATGATWADGDFNYDGIVNFPDLLTLARNYNTALPAEPVAGAPEEFNADLTTAFASTVPEPGLLGVITAVAGCAAARRRRSRGR